MITPTLQLYETTVDENRWLVDFAQSSNQLKESEEHASFPERPSCTTQQERRIHMEEQEEFSDQFWASPIYKR